MRVTRDTVLHCFLVASALLLTVPRGLAEDSAHASNRTVQVSVTATDFSGGRLRYRWRSTDGSIADVNSPTTTWKLPPGPGLHYAYVLVSNGRGGYTERRVAVNTDDKPWVDLSEVESGEASSLAPPRAAEQVGDYLRGFVVSGNVDEFLTDSSGNPYELFHDVYTPDIRVALEDPTTSARYPAQGGVATNSRGEYVIPGVPRGPPSGQEYLVNCSTDKGRTFQPCVQYATNPETVMLDTATPNFSDVAPSSLSNTIAGRICNYFNLKGGGYTVDGACASSLLAVTTACSALQSGDVDVAVRARWTTQVRAAFRYHDAFADVRPNRMRRVIVQRARRGTQAGHHRKSVAVLRPAIGGRSRRRRRRRRDRRDCRSAARSVWHVPRVLEKTRGHDRSVAKLVAPHRRLRSRGCRWLHHVRRQEEGRD